MPVPKKNHLLLILGLFISLCWPHFSQAQSSYLSQKINYRASNQSLHSTLTGIAQEGGFQFSYPSGLIPDDSVLSYASQGRTVRVVLNELLGPGVRAVVIGRHVVLQEDGRQAEAPKEPCFLNGTIWESPRLRKLGSVSVYENAKKKSVLSDAEGNYRIELPPDREAVALSFSLKGFHDTVIVIKPQPELSLDVILTRDIPLPEAIQSTPVAGVKIRPVEELALVQVLVPEQQRNLSLNRILSLRNIPFQISLIPRIGTNRLFSGAMTNRFSLNVLAGYSNEVKGVEIGGLVNITRRNIHGFQAGGLANLVGGQVKGLQAGGLVNVARGSVRGVQAAGIHNSAMDSLEGIQIGGISNLNLGVVKGAQIAGITNFASEDVDGMQIAGLVNQGEKDVDWLQLAGIYNRAKGNVNGAQIAGILNKGERVGGVQIALVNVADSVGGASIGLFSWVKKGYRSIGLQSSEAVPLGLEFRTGTDRLYNIIGAGLRPDGFALGYGLGTIIGKNPKWKGYVEAHAWQLLDSFSFSNMELMASLRTGIMFRYKKLEMGIGPAFRFLISSSKDEAGNFSSEVGANLSFWEKDGQESRLRMWIGAEAYLRLARW